MTRLFLIMLLNGFTVVSGCTTLATETAVSTPSVTTITTVGSGRCPPTDDAPLERNLTVAFQQRQYLLASGELCQPTGDVLTAMPVSSQTRITVLNHSANQAKR